MLRRHQVTEEQLFVLLSQAKAVPHRHHCPAWHPTHPIVRPPNLQHSTRGCTRSTHPISLTPTITPKYPHLPSPHHDSTHVRRILAPVHLPHHSSRCTAHLQHTCNLPLQSSPSHLTSSHPSRGPTDRRSLSGGIMYRHLMPLLSQRWWVLQTHTLPPWLL